MQQRQLQRAVGERWACDRGEVDNLREPKWGGRALGGGEVQGLRKGEVQ